ncbi:Pyrroline-5-carboxylate reductase [Pseudomonas synxantha]|uniref:Pyrroline-5-carboxylate reductase n=1 Tax=Pseudomonas synxantha TaxID=47883 RepID=A0A3G7UAB6_9PSED|nr:pyrroline-5-carboxylate reductase dimerization domain-containing protein [Pseudomonas synxantha]AZE55558.1 Pyrroline-5-carboxylate reductase [Pseudomonas synxantha]
MLSIGILGVGELTEKVVIGLRRGGFSGRVLLSPRNHERARQLGRAWACEVVADNQSVVDQADLLFLGVRPEVVEVLSREVRLKPGQPLVSLVAGMKLEDLACSFPQAQPMRAMLSYAAQINQSTVVVTPAGQAQEALLGTLGTLIVLDQEDAFELATVAACMNGWFYFFLNDLQQWFTDKGLSPEHARQLVMGNMQDCLASAGHQPQARMDTLGNAIATPGTFTAAGLEVLRDKGAPQAWAAACDEVLERLQKTSLGHSGDQ